MALDITIDKNEHCAVISIAGDIDLYSSPEVRTALLNLIKKKASPILVDLAGVSYMDSSGVATFIEGLQMVTKYQGRFALVSLRENVKEVFKLTRLDKIFEIHENLEAALTDGGS